MSYETDCTESMDLWYVQMRDGDTRVLTLDKLDEWFQKGHIDASTLVRQEDETEWRTLGEVAGIEEPAPAPAFVAPPAAVVHTPHAPPTSMSMSVPVSVGSMRAMPMSAPPVAMDLGAGLDLDIPDDFRPRSGKKKWVVLAAAAALVVGGAAFAVTKVGGAGPSTADVAAAAAAAAALPPVIPAAAPPPAVAPPPPPVETKPQLTDEQRKALLDADKSREARSAKLKATRAGNSAPRRAPKGQNPFHKGGNKYDPLNSSL